MLLLVPVVVVVTAVVWLPPLASKSCICDGSHCSRFVGRFERLPYWQACSLVVALLVRSIGTNSSIANSCTCSLGLCCSASQSSIERLISLSHTGGHADSSLQHSDTASQQHNIVDSCHISGLVRSAFGDNLCVNSGRVVNQARASVPLVAFLHKLQRRHTNTLELLGQNVYCQCARELELAALNGLISVSRWRITSLD